MKFDFFCDNCGSNSVYIKPVLTWDIDKQDWNTEDLYCAEAYCEECNSCSSMNSKEIKV